jgi:hypothetical protein
MAFFVQCNRMQYNIIILCNDVESMVYAPPVSVSIIGTPNTLKPRPSKILRTSKAKQISSSVRMQKETTY